MATPISFGELPVGELPFSLHVGMGPHRNQEWSTWPRLISQHSVFPVVIFIAPVSAFRVGAVHHSILGPPQQWMI